ncbi:SdiA-regulated domain-containing protein [Arcobacter sp. LA11]|uniref:SdiA-regulated domain-containing protein n=1 Tax=Arcobacter sp. LA11 TaxID=1898176 RepID=UPI0009335D91|nr:SdiA-regulated domain-containing protein [Arcobacter sp. LA11]
MKIKKIVLMILGLYIFLAITDLNDILYAKVNSIKNDFKGIQTRLNLDKYEVDIEAKKIKSIEDNLSGITYNKNTKTLFAITNSPRKIFELTKNGELLRTINLKGFRDTEGITYLYDNTYAIVDERKGEVFLLSIDKKTKEIDKKETQNILTLKINSYKNFGYEGIAFDKAENTFFIVNEKFPVELIKISNLLKKEEINISLDNGLTTLNHFMSDFSGLHFDNNSRHLLFLSDESSSIAEVSLDGVQVSFADLEKGFLGLKKDVPQAEGITMDEEGTLFIVSEPNLFYRFNKAL